MIGQLRGTILEKQAPHILLDVGGVGYEIDAPMTTFYELPVTGDEVVLYTHLAIREDAHKLYGFVSKSDRSLFRSLIKVSGVGAKLALALLSGMAANEFVNTIKNKDVDSLVKIPGVGKKTAERLVVEMGDRLKDWQGAVVSTEANAINASASESADNSTQDAISALISLGYKPQQASMMVLKVDASAASSEDIIRQALKSVTS
jgi:Holliday junction DNA helicase RuvA